MMLYLPVISHTYNKCHFQYILYALALFESHFHVQILICPENISTFDSIDSDSISLRLQAFLPQSNTGIESSVSCLAIYRQIHALLESSTWLCGKQPEEKGNFFCFYPTTKISAWYIYLLDSMGLLNALCYVFCNTWRRLYIFICSVVLLRKGETENHLPWQREAGKAISMYQYYWWMRQKSRLKIEWIHFHFAGLFDSAMSTKKVLWWQWWLF